MKLRTRDRQLRFCLTFSLVWMICFSYSTATTSGQGSEEDEVVVIEMPKLGEALTAAQVDSFAQLALKNIQTEYLFATTKLLKKLFFKENN